MSTIETAIRTANNENRAAFIPYFILGLPDLKKSIELIDKCSDYFDVLELGIPFSDPVADGPTIQEGALIALENKYSMDDFFKATKKISDKINKPIIYMLYYNQVFGYGIEEFLKKAKKSGVSGLIIPDLLPESDENFINLCNKHGIDTIFLATPLTTEKRIEKIVENDKGFLYLTALIGITGEREKVNTDIKEYTKKLKDRIKKPVCIGFGISTPEHVKNISSFADGVIVGSAIVKKITNNGDVVGFVKNMFEAAKRN